MSFPRFFQTYIYRAGQSSVETSHLDELIELENSYWWHVAKQELATSLLESVASKHSRVVEGGIGAGGNLLRWQKMGYDVAGLDIMPEAISNAKSRGLDNVALHDLHQAWPFESNSTRAIVMLDVLEHLAEPELALRNASEILDRAGKIVFTVPAYPQLYSEWDERLGHYRRYTIEMLQQQVRQAGLYLHTVRFWNAFTLPAAVAVRLYRKWKPADIGAEFPRVSPMVNSLLIGAARCEQFVANRLGLPCGLSLVGVIQK